MKVDRSGMGEKVSLTFILVLKRVKSYDLQHSSWIKSGTSRYSCVQYQGHYTEMMRQGIICLSFCIFYVLAFKLFLFFHF